MPGFAARSHGLLLAVALLGSHLDADPVAVRYPQGSAHGFVALKTLEGKRIATGDMTQIVHGDRVTSRLISSGSAMARTDDDTTVFSQRGVFRLISDHHVQRGPSFPKPIDVLIDALNGEITSQDRDGRIGGSTSISRPTSRTDCRRTSS